MPRLLDSNRLRTVLAWCAVAALATLPAGAAWVNFQDQTSTRLVAATGLGATDPDEKDYAWGDVDKDGDIDLVVVRKQGWTTPGKRVNVLFRNENGVLTDRTTQFATDSSVSGDFGFNTPTNDRDVVLTDVDGDTWLDIVTAVTISDTDPKYIGHPRIYHNKGNDGNGQWLGFRYEETWIPTMLTYSGASGFNPRFCSVAAGDLTGDGKPELWFGDYDASGVGGGSPEPAGADFNDKLLINQGNGHYQDQTTTRFNNNVPSPIGAPFMVSAFGAAAAIADMNGDGLLDIVKQTSLNSPLYVGISQNNPGNQGMFSTHEVITQQSPYFVSVGDLNNDGKLDAVITDDGADRYLINLGNTNPGGTPAFTARNFSFDAASDDGFGSQSVVADLDNDGWNDVLISDVDVDTPGCGRRLHIYRNLGGTPGGMVNLQEQTAGTGCQNSAGNPPTCLVAGIPSDKLEGVHNTAVFDLNGDGWKDLVLGRCAGTSVYLNVPPVGLVFSYPLGLPLFVNPGGTFTFRTQVTGVTGTTPQPGTAKLFTSIGGGPFTQVSMTHLGSNLYEAALPAASCTQTIQFYITADAVVGGTFSDPAGAPASVYRAIAATGTTVTFYDGMESSVPGWAVVNDPALTAGAWEVADPNGTISVSQQAAPEDDAEAPSSAVKAWVTLNGPPGGSAGSYDVDGGPTDLISPAINLAGTDAIISYSRWMFSSSTDVLQVAVSNNGTNWVTAETINGVNNIWTTSSFKVGDFVTPTSTVRVRFRVTDVAPAGTVEAGVDAFQVEQFQCTATGAPSGRVPDGNVPGTPLKAQKLIGNMIKLTWSPSCTLGDNDYEVYEGAMGSFSTYTPRSCSTGGATTSTFSMPAGSVFWLVVPTNGSSEGSYGVNSSGVQRAPSASACRSQNAAACQ